MVSWETTPPAAFATKISPSVPGVAENAMLVPSGDQLTPRATPGAEATLSIPVPSMLTTYRLPPSRFERKATFLPSGEIAGLRSMAPEVSCLWSVPLVDISQILDSKSEALREATMTGQPVMMLQTGCGSVVPPPPVPPPASAADGVRGAASGASGTEGADGASPHAARRASGSAAVARARREAKKGVMAGVGSDRLVGLGASSSQGEVPPRIRTSGAPAGARHSQVPASGARHRRHERPELRRVEPAVGAHT